MENKIFRGGMIIMVEMTQKGELLEFRGKIQGLIEELNEKCINTNDYIGKETAMEVRESLIEADNTINAFRLRTRRVD